MSKIKPCPFNCLALPPAVWFFSITVTSQPAFAIKDAADKPAKPLPITISFLLNACDVLFIQLAIYGQNCKAVWQITLFNKLTVKLNSKYAQSDHLFKERYKKNRNVEQKL